MADRIEFDLAKVESLAERGLTQAQIADALGVSDRTVSYRMAEGSDFADAVKRGQAKGIAFVANKLMEQVKGNNIAATIFYLKARGGWRETSAIEHAGPGGGPVQFERIERVVIDPQKPAE